MSKSNSEQKDRVNDGGETNQNSEEQKKQINSQSNSEEKGRKRRDERRPKPAYKSMVKRMHSGANLPEENPSPVDQQPIEQSVDEIEKRLFADQKSNQSAVKDVKIQLVGEDEERGPKVKVKLKKGPSREEKKREKRERQYSNAFVEPMKGGKSKASE